MTYRPIPCVSHERLEFAALKKQWLEMEILQGEHAGRHRLLPIDIYAREGSEWLEAQAEGGKKLTVRLDWLSF